MTDYPDDITLGELRKVAKVETTPLDPIVLVLRSHRFTMAAALKCAEELRAITPETRALEATLAEAVGLLNDVRRVWGICHPEYLGERLTVFLAEHGKQGHG